MLAAVYVMPVPASELWTNSNAALDRAIELDPELPQPHATRGYLRYWVGRWEDAEAPLARALELDPDYTDAMQWLAEVYSRLGRAEAAERLIQRALSREPFSRGVTSAAAEVYYLTDLEEAVSYCLRLLELGQTEVGLQALWYGLLYDDRIDEARTRAGEWVDALELPPGQVGGAFDGARNHLRCHREVSRQVSPAPCTLRSSTAHSRPARFRSWSDAPTSASRRSSERSSKTMSTRWAFSSDPHSGRCGTTRGSGP